jgi:hypothetical protein
MLLYKKSCENFTVVKSYGEQCRILCNSSILCIIDQYTYEHQLVLGFNNDDDFVNVVGVDEL